MTTERLFRVIGQRVRERRTLLAITQQGLARRTGISRSSIANLERGHQQMSLPQLYLIAEALGLDISQLLPTKGELPRARKVAVVVDGVRRSVAPEIAEFVKALLTAKLGR